jgi:hypothetical protein
MRPTIVLFTLSLAAAGPAAADDASVPSTGATVRPGPSTPQRPGNTIPRSRPAEPAAPASGSAAPSPDRAGGARVIMALPPDREEDSTPRVVPVAPIGRNRPSADAGHLAGIRATPAGRGALDVALPGSLAARTVRVGDRIGDDVVTAVAPGLMKLRRPAGPDDLGDGIVVVRFDAQGRGVVHVYSHRRPPLDGAPPAASGPR